MINIHCHTCGGFVSDPRRVTHRLPLDGTVIAVPRTDLCSCTESVIFGPPAGRASSQGKEGAGRLS